jgi:hypothetical protein
MRTRDVIIRLTDAISQAEARDLVAGRTEKPGGVDPAAFIDACVANGRGFRVGSIPLALFAACEEGDGRYDGTVDHGRAQQYRCRATEAPPIIAVTGRRSQTLRVMDGGHRITAARWRGDSEIRAIVGLADDPMQDEGAQLLRGQMEEALRQRGSDPACVLGADDDDEEAEDGPCESHVVEPGASSGATATGPRL